MDRKPGSPAPRGGSGNQVKPTPAESLATKPPVQIRADASTFELFSREASAEELRDLTRVLNDWARGDQQGFPCQFSLITRNQFRANAAVPIEMARVLDQYKHVTEDGTRQFAQVADTVVAELHGSAGKLQASAEGFDATTVQAKERIEGAMGAMEASVGRFCAQMEAERTARNQRVWAWALGAGIVVAALGWLATYQLERQAGERWKAEQMAQLAQWRARQAADWPKWAESQVQARLQALEPATYRLAQQIERSKRQVKLPEGGTVWEVTLFDDGGILSVDTSFDAQNIRQRYQVRLRDDPERMALSATAPVAGSGGKERARP